MPDDYSDIFSDIDPDFNFIHSYKLVVTPYITEEDFHHVMNKWTNENIPFPFST